MVNNARAFNRLSTKYYETYGKNPEYQYFLEELTDIVRKGKILDVGCGAGIPVAKYLIDRGYDVTAVDFSKKMAEEARKNVPEAQILHEDITKLEAEPDSFDGAVVFFSFNFLTKKDMERAFENINNSLKEEAGIIIGAIEGEFEGQETMLGEKIYLRQLTEFEIRSMLSNYKVQRVERREYNAPDDKHQTQMYIIAKKKNWQEANQTEETVIQEGGMIDEFSKQLEQVLSIGLSTQGSAKEEVSEVATELHAEESKVNVTASEIPVNVRYDDSESDEEEPAIRISFFKKGKK